MAKSKHLSARLQSRMARRANVITQVEEAINCLKEEIKIWRHINPHSENFRSSCAHLKHWKKELSGLVDEQQLDRDLLKMACVVERAWFYYD